jgi:aminopeptidase-like protein
VIAGQFTAEPGAVRRLIEGFDAETTGRELHAFVRELQPHCRSITGQGLRDSLEAVRRRIPMEIREVPTGTRVLDWEVPREWNLHDAWIRDPHGRRIVQSQDSCLHVMSYSVPVHRTLSLQELEPHLHSIPARPDWIPYRTSYYQEDWGFCVPHRLVESLPEGEYEVRIDATLGAGHLTFGECLLPGESREEVLLSCHCCHPVLCNDNLSGMAVATWLAALLGETPRRYTYRFLFVPVTIGAITWLALNRETTHRIQHGLVLAGVGDAGHSTYKRSRRGDATIDRAVEHVLRHMGAHEIMDFVPYGYDERQYCSPGFDLPVGCLMRTPWGRYPEYHTSADDPDFVRPESLADTLIKCLSVVEVLEENGIFRNTSPHGEPQLGRRGLFGALGGEARRKDAEMALLWVLNLSDGYHSLLGIAERSGLPFAAVARAARLLVEHGLLEAERDVDASPAGRA